MTMFGRVPVFTPFESKKSIRTICASAELLPIVKSVAQSGPPATCANTSERLPPTNVVVGIVVNPAVDAIGTVGTPMVGTVGIPVNVGLVGTVGIPVNVGLIGTVGTPIVGTVGTPLKVGDVGIVGTVGKIGTTGTKGLVGINGFIGTKVCVTTGVVIEAVVG